MTRVALVHAFAPSIAPLHEAFRVGWPEADVVNLLDDSLYADVDVEGVAPPGMVDRVRSLLLHAELAGADVIVFTGTTFGPLVEEARSACSVPVLKADEALAEAAVRAGRRILILCTATRAQPAVRANLERAAAAAKADVDIREAVAAGAQAALLAGDADSHDAIIAATVAAVEDADVVTLAQMSMARAARRLPPFPDKVVLTSPEATVAAVRRLAGRPRT